MTSKKRITKEEIKDWFIIQRIRILNFIREHKYISAGIGTFILSCIILLVAFANTNDPYKGKIKATINSVSQPNSQTIKSFSTQVYDINYTFNNEINKNNGDLGDFCVENNSSIIRDSVIITASFTTEGYIDAHWVTSTGQGYQAEYGKTDDKEDKTKLKVTAYSVDICEQNIKQQIYLKINNAEKGAKIKTTINIIDGPTFGELSTYDENLVATDEEETAISSDLTELNFSTIIKGGKPYTNANLSNGKLIPFGIIIKANTTNLEGQYFDPNLEINLNAIDNFKNTLELVTDSKLYDENLKFFGEYVDSGLQIHGMPDGVNSNSSEIKLESSVNIEFTEATSSQTTEQGDVYQLKAKFTKDNGSLNPIYSINDSEYQSCTDTSKCSVFYYKDESLTEEIDVNLSAPNTYYAKFIYNDEENGITSLEAVSIITISMSNGDTSYKLNITDLKISEDIIAQDNEIILGTFFVTVKSIFPENERVAEVTLSSESSEATSAATVINYKKSLGTKMNEITFNTDSSGDLESLDGNTAAYGEEVILKSNFNFMNDGDTKLLSLTNNISLGNNLTIKECSTDEENNMEICAYGTTSSSLQYYLKINDKEIVSLSDENNPQYLNEEEELVTIEDMNFEVVLEEDEIGYTITNVEPGTIIDFRVRLIIGTLYYNEKPYEVTSSANYEQEGLYDESEVVEDKVDNKGSIYITPFKARNRILINEYDQDAIVNGADIDKNKSKFSIYPSISLPANLINTNAVAAENIEAKIIVTLPKGINYIYNEIYGIPTITPVEDGRTRLTYNLKNAVVNEWIEPIIFEGSYDIDIQSGSELVIESEIQAVAKNLAGNSDDKTDNSLIDLRTAKRKITYQNDEQIAYLQYANKSVISKDEEFSMKVEIFNNTTDDKTNIDIITILPYNEEESNKFNGYYEASFESGSSCTSDLVTPDTIKSGLINWIPCDSYEEKNSDSEERITAIKTTFETLVKNEKASNSITISTHDNQTGDKYIFSSYVVTYDENNIVNITHMDDLEVDVVSKQITGIVWEDFDDDGIMVDNEKRISDVTLKLFDSSTNEMVSSTLSDGTGKYALTELEENKTYYVVAEFNTTKYGISPRVGIDKSVNSAFYSTENKDPEDDLPVEEEQNINKVIIRTDDIYISSNTKIVNNINLGLSLQKVYTVTLNKYITKAIVTNNIGVATTKDYGKATLAKLDVKDINNLNIKVVYTIELENTGHYPGYIYNVKDYIPYGMNFNASYAENDGWILNSDGYLENKTLSEDLIEAGQKKYLTLALDISRKEAGSFINNASVDEEDLQILVISKGKGE